MRPFDNAAAMGSGGATVAAPGTQFAITNEAQLGGATTGVWVGTAVPYSLGGWQSANFQGVYSLGKRSGGLGLEVQHAGVDALVEQRFRVQYGRFLGEKIRIGASLDALRQSAKEYGSANNASFSLSVLARALPQVYIGAKVQNPFQMKIGPDLLPTVFRVGASWVPSGILLVLAEVEKDLERQAAVKAGVEYRPVPRLALRLGVRSAEVSRMAFGVGLPLKNGLQVDVASEWHPVLGITPAVLLSYRKKAKSQ